MRRTILVQLLLVVIVVFSDFRSLAQACLDDQAKVHAYIERAIDSSHYSRWLRPITPDGRPTAVNVSMEMKYLAHYNDLQSAFELYLIVQQEWFDPRLIYNVSYCQNLDNNNNNNINATVARFRPLEGNDFHFMKIWKPNLRIIMNKNTNDLGSADSLITQLTFMRIYPSGRVMARMRANLNLICPIDYRLYPFDSQTCYVQLIANDLPARELKLQWSEATAFYIDESLFMASHSFQDVEARIEGKQIAGEIFSMLVVELSMARQWGHYLLVIFLPSVLIVATSWLTLWMDVTMNARGTIAVTTLLALVTVSREAREDMPVIPYFKAIDFWFAGCTLSIFGVLIQYICMLYVHREETKKTKTRKSKKKLRQKQISLISIDTIESGMIEYVEPMVSAARHLIVPV